MCSSYQIPEHSKMKNSIAFSSVLPGNLSGAFSPGDEVKMKIFSQFVITSITRVIMGGIDFFQILCTFTVPVHSSQKVCFFPFCCFCAPHPTSSFLPEEKQKQKKLNCRFIFWAKNHPPQFEASPEESDAREKRRGGPFHACARV